MTIPDLVCLALIALTLLIDHFVSWPSFLRRSKVDPGRARLWLYSAGIGQLWTLAALVAVLWLYEGRPWRALRLIAPDGWRLWASLGLVLSLAIALAMPIFKIARPGRTRRFRMSAEVEARAPHTRSELGLWAALSVSAGCSEELVFRGYLIWVFQPLLGLWGAAALSVAVFTVAHGYEGARSALAAGVVGGLLTAAVLLLGSLWPAIAMHVLVDLQQGLVAWLLLRRAPGGEAMAVLPV